MCEYVYVPVCPCVYSVSLSVHMSLCAYIEMCLSMGRSQVISADPGPPGSCGQLGGVALVPHDLQGMRRWSMEPLSCGLLRQSCWTHRVHMAWARFKLCHLTTVRHPEASHPHAKGDSLFLGCGPHVSRIPAQCPDVVDAWLALPLLLFCFKKKYFEVLGLGRWQGTKYLL